MSGVIDDNGVGWERCNGCGEFVRMDELLYARIRPELIEAREARADAWVAEAEASPMIECYLCAGTGVRPDWRRFRAEPFCNGCESTGRRHEIGPRGRGPRLTGDELLDLCNACARDDEPPEHVGPALVIEVGEGPDGATVFDAWTAVGWMPEAGEFEAVRPRDRKVPCKVCRRKTWNVSALCDAHEEEEL